MPSVESLAQDNRTLRNRFKAGLDNRKAPIDGPMWPLVYLGAKILKHEESVEILAEHNLGTEAGIIVRVMFEAAVNIMWLLKSQTVEDIIDNLKRYMSYQAVLSQKYRDYMRQSDFLDSVPDDIKSNILNDLDTMDERAREIQNEYEFNQYKPWSGKSVKQMAIDVGWKDHYDTLYQMYSDIIHSGITAVPEYLIFDNKGKITVNFKSQTKHCKTCLIMAKNYLITAFSFLDVFLELGLEELVDQNLPKNPYEVDLNKLRKGNLEE